MCIAIYGNAYLLLLTDLKFDFDGRYFEFITLVIACHVRYEHNPYVLSISIYIAPKNLISQDNHFLK